MGDSLYYKIYILFSNLFNIQYNYIVTNTIININMKKAIASFTYKLEEMNLDLVEQAIQNIASKRFGAAGLAVTPFTLI